MSADLDRKADGSAAMFSVRETPWHREGVVLAEAPTHVADALAIAGLDWDVTLAPLYRAVNDGADFVEVEGSKLILRTDRQQPLGVVGRHYRPLQNRDAFRVLEPLLDAGLATFETAGAIREGRDVWAQLRFHLPSSVVTEIFADEVVPYATIINNHAGEKTVQLAETPQRIVCANTLGFARQGFTKTNSISVRHTGAVEGKAVEAAMQLFGDVVQRYEGIARQYQTLKGMMLDEAMFRRLVLNAVAPLPDLTKVKPENRKRAETRHAKVTEDRRILTRLWTEGTGHTGNLSAWEAYNAVAEAADHGLVPSWAVKGSVVRSLLDGKLGEAKAAAIESLMGAAEERGLVRAA